MRKTSVLVRLAFALPLVACVLLPAGCADEKRVEGPTQRHADSDSNGGGADRAADGMAGSDADRAMNDMERRDRQNRAAQRPAAPPQRQAVDQPRVGGRP